MDRGITSSSSVHGFYLECFDLECVTQTWCLIGHAGPVACRMQGRATADRVEGPYVSQTARLGVSERLD